MLLLLELVSLGVFLIRFKHLGSKHFHRTAVWLNSLLVVAWGCYETQIMVQLSLWNDPYDPVSLGLCAKVRAACPHFHPSTSHIHTHTHTHTHALAARARAIHRASLTPTC
jgi:hypothetical protein